MLLISGFSGHGDCPLAVGQDEGPVRIPRVEICENCPEARGINYFQLIEGTGMSTMAELSQWAVGSD